MHLRHIIKPISFVIDKLFQAVFYSIIPMFTCTETEAIPNDILIYKTSLDLFSPSNGRDKLQGRGRQSFSPGRKELRKLVH